MSLDFNVLVGRVSRISDFVVTIFNGKDAQSDFDFSGRVVDFKVGDILKTTTSGDKLVDAEVLARCTDNPFQLESLVNKCHKLNMEYIIKQRQNLQNVIRDIYNKNSYLEVESPVLVDSPGLETYLEGFSTIYYDYDKNAEKFYLPTSPEYGLKKLVGATLSSVYSFARSFRNYGEESQLHKKEFTMLEWYKIGADYKILIDELEAFFADTAKKFLNTTTVSFKGNKCDFGNSYKVAMKDLFARHNINLDLYTIDGATFVEQVKTFYDEQQTKLSDNMNKDDYFFKFFMDNIEPSLGFDKPCIVYDYPIEMCPLSLPSENVLYGQRFEVYICGVEVANGYTELVDYQRQSENFKHVYDERVRTGCIENVGLPQDFLQTLKFGVPPCAGCALGFDRLMMILLDFNDVHSCNWY